MRRLLRDVAENRSLGDVSTLTDSGILKKLRDDRIKENPLDQY
jgi:acetyl-CoA synthetase